MSTDFWNELNDALQVLNASLTDDKIDDMESYEVIQWFSNKITDSGGNLEQFVRIAGYYNVTKAINRLKIIIEDPFEEDFVKISAQLQYATCLLTGISSVIDANPYKAVALLRNNIKLSQLLLISNTEPLLEFAINDIYARSYYLLAVCCIAGEGCEENYSAGIRYLQQAAELGLDEAKDILGEYI